MREGGSCHISLPAVLAGIAFCLLTGRPARCEDIVVREIEVQGLHRYDRALILSKIQTKEGALFNRDTLQQDIQRLYQCGYFSDIQFFESPIAGAPNQLKITLKVEESQVIQEIKLTGNKEFDDKDLLKEFRLKNNDLFSRYLLQIDMETIRKKYQEKGYNFVSVADTVKPVPGGVSIELAVREGPRVTVEDIDIEGNKEFTDSAVKDVMHTQENAWYSSHPFRESDLPDDVERIKAYYRSEGFLDVQAAVEEIRYNTDKTEVSLRIHVDEGARYTIREVQIEGNKLFPADKCISVMEVRPGDFFVGRKVDRDVGALRDLWGKEGYCQASVDVKPQITDEAGKLKLVYSITEGAQFRVERVDVEGNNKTKDKVIRRSLPLFPGEICDTTRLKRGMQNLQAMQYFDDVSYTMEDGDLPGYKHIILHVKEGSTGSIRFGGGYSSNYGFLGLIELKQRNFDIANLPHSLSDLIDGTGFAGAGQIMTISAQPGQNRSRYAIDFKEPYLFDWPVGYGVGFFNYQTSRLKYDESRIGGYNSFDYRFESGWIVGLTLRAEDIQVSNVDSFAPPEVLQVQGESLLQTVGPSISYETRDNPIYPSKGYKVYLGNETAGLLGGDYHFNKLVFDGDLLLPMYTTDTGGKHTLNFKTTLGWAGPWNGEDDLPIFERFYAGGSGTVRGFAFRTISPKVGGFPVGGDALATLGAEYSFPLYRTEVQDRKMDIIRGAFFLDSGDCEAGWGDISWSSWRIAAGFGLRFTIPQLGQVPIALDFGFPIKQKSDDESQIFALNLGYYY